MIHFRMNKDLYPKDIVLAAISDFKDVAKITLKDEMITLSSDEDETLLKDEFCNYALGLLKSKGV